MVPRENDLQLARAAVEAVVRVGLLLILIFWCFWIARPFIVPVLWGMIIAIAVHPGHARLSHLLGGRTGLAAVIVTVLALVLLGGPLTLLTTRLVQNIVDLATTLKAEGLAIPPPPAKLALVPLIGPPVDQLWRLASVNIMAALAQVGPQLRSAAGWVLALIAGTGLGLLQFTAAIVIAGVLLARSEAGHRAAVAVATRLVGEPGPGLAEVAEQTIRNVIRGLLGTALIQALLAGLGFVAVGLPAAAILALICFLLAVVQIGAGLVLIPAVIYVFTSADTLTAVLFFVWSVFVGLIDNVLRPILMSRGGDVPLVVILIGVLGGLIAHGLIGLFVGPIVFTLGYELFRAWLTAPPPPSALVPPIVQLGAARVERLP